MTRSISLTKGKAVLIDDVDSDLESSKWFTASRKGQGLNTRYYASKMEVHEEKRCMVLMHRVIMSRILGRELTKDEQVDHVDHDGLNNRRGNLRVATNQQNQQNQRISLRKKSSRFKGVSWAEHANKWRAMIWSDRKPKHLGYFETEELAAQEYDKAAKEMYGEHSCLNFPSKKGGVKNEL